MAELNSEQIAELKNMLQERERALREDIRREMSQQDNYADVAAEVPDPGDASFADLSVDLGNAAVTRDLTELRAIQNAYTRMDNGTYGECAECGLDIPFERLKVQPMAERCAPCQGQREKTHIDSMKGSTM
ncbi:TraR/DksA family transcriptional regulator [Paucimonas lemoignei]|uniref:TraR/DksA family transcriptional regulator n=1 Tax=Paucimonas lemoignei TaxID=29443 RepID=A0A4V2UI90_PAULE|nr:TraR/DksA C4-type zinc finger protein [Paucimonas lemoignei]TCS34381.1 TraR/DksA family transcriptional regulator [Paucimonas lemoignei]